MRGQRGSEATSRLRTVRQTLRLTPQAWLTLDVLGTLCFLAFVFVSRQLEIGRRARWIADLSQAHVVALEDQAGLRDQLASANDLDAIEYEARKRLGLVLPGEVKVVFVEEP